ncbi:MAG: type II toxin-antitoxin system RelE/ParE family toxin [Caulobacteraceae bacterium]
MAKVVWTDAALANLDGIEAYILPFNPLAAQRMSRRLIAAALSLEGSPERGRPIGRTRELTAVWPYVIRYRIDGDVVTILRIRHGARRR